MIHHQFGDSSSCELLFLQKTHCDFEEGQGRPHKLVCNILVFEKERHNFGSLAEETLKATVSESDEIRARVLVIYTRAKPTALFDSENKCSNCIALRAALPCQTHKDNCKKLIDSVKFHSHDVTDGLEGLFCDVTDFQVRVCHGVYKLENVLLQ